MVPLVLWVGVTGPECTATHRRFPWSANATVRLPFLGENPAAGQAGGARASTSATSSGVSTQVAAAALAEPVRFRRAGDDRSHDRLGGEPGQGQLQHGVPPFARPRRGRLDHIEVPVRQQAAAPLAEVDQPGAGRYLLSPRVLAREHAAGQWVVGRNSPEPLGLGHGVGLVIPLQEVPLVLHGDEPGTSGGRGPRPPVTGRH